MTIFLFQISQISRSKGQAHVNIHVKYQRSSTHYSNVIYKLKFSKSRPNSKTKVTTDPRTKTLRSQGHKKHQYVDILIAVQVSFHFLEGILKKLIHSKLMAHFFSPTVHFNKVNMNNNQSESLLFCWRQMKTGQTRSSLCP